MADWPNTRASLVARIQDARDEQAWSQFVDLYAPVVYGYARRQGLQDADAADLTQEVLRAVARSVGRQDYDPGRGSFRSWIFTLARNRVRNFLSRRKPDHRGSGDTDVQRLLDAQPAREGDQDDLWDRDYRRRLFAWAAEQVRGSFQDSSWQAFWRTAVEGQGVREVAGELGLTVAAVYLARSRVMARLREQIQQAEEQGSP